MRTSSIVLAILVPSWTLTLAAGRPRDEAWQKVDEAMQKGLPKTAIELLQPIAAAAMQEGSYAEAIKAIGRTIAFEARIRNDPAYRITRMKDEIAKAPAPMRPVMQAILAHWYAQHLWGGPHWLAREDPVPADSEDDFTRWSRPRIFAEIEKLFAEALSAKEVLQRTPIAQYEELLIPGTMPDACRPTLFDFVAHQAVMLYGSHLAALWAGQRTILVGVGWGNVSESWPIFEPIETFLKWEIDAGEASPTLRAIRIYQDLLRFHRNDADPTAFREAELGRIVFGGERATKEVRPRYVAALARLADEWAGDEMSARVLYHWADAMRQTDDPAGAHRIACRGRDGFPESLGGRQCSKLIGEIERRWTHFSTEGVWNKPWPTIDVRYTNVTRIHFRLIVCDWKEWPRAGDWDISFADEEYRRGLLARKPDVAWSVDLPPTPDFKGRLERTAVPSGIPPGPYFLIASPDEAFREQDNEMTWIPVWVSELALVVRTEGDEKEVAGLVLHAESGEPIEGAVVSAWDLSKDTPFAKALTEPSGLFRLPAHPEGEYLEILHVRFGDQSIVGGQNREVWHDGDDDVEARTILFTDRFLYRPGQTIRYKGICVNADQRFDQYKTLANRSVTVVFRDANRTEFGRAVHRTNEYGSFSGSFIVPAGRLTGSFSISVKDGPDGETSFRVEEYKRPTFRVTLDPPDVPPRLGGRVRLKGAAISYTDAPVNGAKLRFSVSRGVEYPGWWHWRFWWRRAYRDGGQVAQGSCITAADGSFAIEFTAEPNPNVMQEEEPVFEYTISADVTDPAGETRSAERTLRAGYTVLQASLSAGEWQTIAEPVEVRIETRTLDGEPHPAKGTLKVLRLKEPERVSRPRWDAAEIDNWYDAMDRQEPDPSNPNTWPLGEAVAEKGAATDGEGKATATFRLPVGMYRAFFEAEDPSGKTIRAELPITVIDPGAERLAIKVPDLLVARSWTLEPGEEFVAVWGSGYETVRAFVEVECRGEILQRYWTERGRTQALIRQKVTEEMRGGFTVRVTMVRENRPYLHQEQIDVPWSNKRFTIRWEHFVSKLEPGGRETWTAVISGPDGERAAAEMVASLYDASLDVFLNRYFPEGWPTSFNVFRWERLRVWSRLENPFHLFFHHFLGEWSIAREKRIEIRYPAFPRTIIGSWRGRLLDEEPALIGEEETMSGLAPPDQLSYPGATKDEAQVDEESSRTEPGKPSAPDLSKIAPRANLNETAFFFPHLVSGEDGVIRIEFTMPEALTEWRFMGFAHDQRLRSGFLEGRAVTSKDLMVQPNPPRFLREGDVVEFTVRVANQSVTRQTGTVRLTFADARSGECVDAAIGNSSTDLAFDIPSKESRSFSWHLAIPDGMDLLTYKAVGSTERLSDGEEGYLPVLSRRIPVTESLPLLIRGPETKIFEFTRLRNSGDSETLCHASLTVEVVSNPAWCAVMSLPYLMEFPHDCSEQVFERLYANALARHIAKSDPRIRRVFDQWKATPALASPFEKNQHLKSVVLEETPWVRQAQSESEARRNVGILFDENRLDQEIAAAWHELYQMRYGTGLWPWFPGGEGDEYITLTIVSGFGRLRHLGVEIDVGPAVKAIERLDKWIAVTHMEIPAERRKDNHLSPTIALYLYARSFFLQDTSMTEKAKEAIDYFLDQARTHWPEVGHRQSQAQLAIALKRFGERVTPAAILRSIREFSVSDEMGMSWRDKERSWWWYRAPIETQAMMIEAFDEVAGDAKAVEECKRWLLMQKQTQGWGTTKATADAVYALLRRGRDLLASTALVEVSLGGTRIEPEKIEAGTGFYEKRFAGSEVTPALGEISVKKIDEGIAWGGVHWQYLEDVKKIAPYEGTPLALQKTVFVKMRTPRGPVLERIRGPLAVGDEVVVRLELRADRDMEYLHLKDSRGSGTEPMNVLSGMRYRQGIRYYESTRDSATHFFIDRLPRGTYILEHSARVVHRGRYETGIAEVECMYAPEFNAHSGSFGLEVR